MARSVAGPYSQLTTQSGRARDSARPMPRATVIGARPGRSRCHAESTSLEYPPGSENHALGWSQPGWLGAR